MRKTLILNLMCVHAFASVRVIIYENNEAGLEKPIRLSDRCRTLSKALDDIRNKKLCADSPYRSASPAYADLKRHAQIIYKFLPVNRL